MESVTQQRFASITVAVATLDRPDGVARCLDAIVGGTVRPAEIVVVDQGRTDATERLIAARFPHPELTYIRQTRRGLSASRNRAVAAARQPLIAFTDDDCVPDRRWVEMIERAMSDPCLAAVTGQVLDLGPDPVTPDARPSSLRRGAVVRTFRRRALPWKVGTGGNMSVRREWLERVGPFDEMLGAGSKGQSAEDMDVIHRLLRTGGTIRFDPVIRVRHARHSPAVRRSNRLTYGFGMGTFCALWISRGDRYAALIWARWMLDRLYVAASGVRHGRWRQVQEQGVYLRGAVRGFRNGLGRRGR